MYGFSDFTCTLNEPETGVCPTDSRLRPDQRIMENGDYDNANNEKVSCNIAAYVNMYIMYLTKSVLYAHNRKAHFSPPLNK